MTTTRTTRRTHSRPGVVSDHSDQWLDITKEPSDQSQMSTSSWAGPLPQGSDQVSIQKASQANQCREEVGLIIASYESVY